MNQPRLCLYCQKRIYGRTDKKFCNGYCRSSYHNTHVGPDQHFIRRVNYQLQKNRKIMASIMANGHKEVEISSRELSLRGFNFSFFTHLKETKQTRQPYHYCYEYGYCILKEDKVSIVQDDGT